MCIRDSYTALDLAVLLSLRDLGVREEAALLERDWAEEQAFLEPDLIKSKRTFVLDVAYWSLYFREKPCIDREFPMIQRDAAGYGAHLSAKSFLHDFSDLDLYFKEDVYKRQVQPAADLSNFPLFYHSLFSDTRSS